ncbi:MAG: ankyrin repeat domain-containing protein [Lewinella sp.]|nr:ankyrin repeat domain-containing protein [Lewinella sp.]
MRNLLLLSALLLWSVGMNAQDTATTDEPTLPTPQEEGAAEPAADYGVLNMPSDWDKLKDEKRVRFLFAAVERGDVELARTMLPDVRLPYYQYNDQGETLLTLAVKSGNFEMVNWLCDDAVINLKNQDGETPLTLAIKGQLPPIIDRVLDRAKADLPNDTDETPLTLAIRYSDDVGLLRDLILAGADVDRQANGISPLSLAVELGETRSVAMLVRHGADPSLPNADGIIPLYQAVDQSDPVLAGILLHKSPHPMRDARWATHDGETLLNLSITQRNSALARVLVDGGADIEAVDYLENTPLVLAAERGMGDIVQLLLDYGADPNHANIVGTTALVAAAQNGHQEVANVLTLYGANPNLHNYEGWAATDYMIEFSDPAMTEAVEEALDDVE